jgi:hypothetical protein
MEALQRIGLGLARLSFIILWLVGFWRSRGIQDSSWFYSNYIISGVSPSRGSIYGSWGFSVAYCGQVRKEVRRSE